MRIVPEGPLPADVEVAARDHGRDRQDAAAEGLAEHDDVGRHLVVLAGEHAAGLAEASRNLVEDQKRPVPPTSLLHGLPVAGRRQIRHRARGLGDHRRHVPLAREHIVDHFRAGEGANLEPRPAVLVDRVSVRAAIAGERGDVLAARHQGRGRARAEQRLARKARSTEPRAVEGVPERQRLEAPRRRAGELDGDFHRIRTAGGEKYLVEPLGRDPRKLCRECVGDFVGIAARRERQGVHLRGDGALQARVPVADVVDVVAMEIHVAAALDVLDPDALRLGDGIQAGGGDRLPQEVLLVRLEHRPRASVEGTRLPLRPPRGEIGVALRLAGALLHGPSRQTLRTSTGRRGRAGRARRGRS